MNQENENQVETPEINKEQIPESEPVAESSNKPTPEQTTTPEVEPANNPTQESAEQTPAPATSEPVAPAPAENHQPKVQDEVIYKMKEEKGGNVFGVIFFFAILFAALYFLPTISETLEPYIPWIKNISKKTAPAPEETENKSESETENKKEEELYDLSGFVSNAVIDDLQLGNFVKDNNSGDNNLKFYILNNGDEAFIFNDNTKFYIDLYEGEKYLSSSLIYSYKDIGPKESIDFTIVIPNESYKKADKFKIVRKSKNDYKDVVLKTQDGEYQKLTCEYKNNIIEYYFIDNYLEVIKDTYSEKIDDPNYAQDIEKYRQDAQKYENYPSIDYNIIESAEGVNIKSTIELEKINDVDLQKIAVYKYFSYHKENKVVSFEMTSLGYKCS